MTEFTMSDFVLVQPIVKAVTAKSNKIAMYRNGSTIYGIARRIGDESGCSIRRRDIREQFLWITTQGGMELFIPIAELMELVRTGDFGLYDW
jgi:hypothetical protein